MCEKLVAALRSLSHLDTRVEYVTDSDPQALSAPNALSGITEVSADAVKEHPDLAALHRAMNVNQVSCTLKHISALRRVAANAAAAGGFHLVLEDDCLFGEEQALGARLKDILSHVPTDYDLVFLGLPTPNVSEMDNTDRHFVKVGDKAMFHRLCSPTMPLLPCCESYLVNPVAAARMLSIALPIRFVANLHLTYLIRRLSLSTYASMPNVFVDGSKIGVFVSQLDPNNRLLWNESFLKLEALTTEDGVKELQREPARMQEAQAFIDKLPFRGHPDILRLLARLQLRLGNFKEALEIFEQVHTIQVTEKCILNSTSQSLRDHMNLYRYLQDQELKIAGNGTPGAAVLDQVA
jgi:GR25 family glycosyltransferase involved in LPS biosynthesis